MIINNNVINAFQEGKGEGYYITPEVLLWRSVIVRAIMDALDIDIHAWGLSRRRIVEEANAWFDTKDPYFVEVCENGNMSAYWVCRIFEKLISIFSSFPIPLPMDIITSEDVKSICEPDSLNFSPGIIVLLTFDKSRSMFLISDCPLMILSALKHPDWIDIIVCFSLDFNCEFIFAL